jgi:hypothetical protein
VSDRVFRMGMGMGIVTGADGHFRYAEALL